jgi:methylated-DNA-[protein]-cysteine S-methyltransferase
MPEGRRGERAIGDAQLALRNVDTPIGDVRIAVSADAVVAVALPGSASFTETCACWLDVHPEAAPAGRRFADDIAERVRRYFRGEVFALVGLPTSLAVPAASRRVLEAVMDIPPGETRAYSDIAHMLGYGRLGARFVGSVNARNPIPLIIPCHRVIGRDGSLVGFGGRLQLKAWLLAWEAENTTARASQ